MRPPALQLLSLHSTIQPSTSEAAPAKLVAGTFTCKGHGGVGLILGSQETLRCIFTSPNGAHHRRYVATITKVGVDIGFKGETYARVDGALFDF